MSFSFPPKKQPCNCGYFINRGVSIDAVITNNKDEILCIKRGVEPFKGFWGLVGGYVEWDESVEACVKREVREEVGLVVKSLHLIGVYSDPQRHPRQVINVAYAVDTKGELRAGDDALEIKFFPVDKLPKNLAFDHRDIIQDYLMKSEV
ncbi:NUDIX hydrolase [Candidatus Dojkabacteria bacterium]|nr:NUDIX hydrolase [Candidatus Dojkabacteria bacterium]